MEQDREPNSNIDSNAQLALNDALPQTSPFVVASAGFSAQADDNDMSIDAARYSADIVRLVLSDEYLQLASGDVWPLAVWGVDAKGRKVSDAAFSFECLPQGLAQGSEQVIKIFSGCQIAGLSPGVAQVQVRYISASGTTLMSDVVNVEVTPKALNTVNGVISFVMNDWQEELWLTFPGLQAGAFYRAFLFSADGRLPFRTMLEVTPNFADVTQACQNTLPFNATQVACYFYSQGNAVSVVIKNVAKVQFQGQLMVEPAQEKAQFSVSYSKFTAKSIFVNSAETHYVFANEIGQSSANFFRFKQDTKPIRPLKVTLFDFAYPVWLNVSWGRKVCTDDMIDVTSNTITCNILSEDAADVLIGIDGNNRIGRINAPAAVEGGTTYSLLVEYL